MRSLIRSIFVAGLLVGAIAFGATTAQNIALIEQLKKDKSLQEAAKNEIKKQAPQGVLQKDATLKTPIGKTANATDENATTEDPLEISDENNISLGKEKKYTQENYYKAFTPFFYEDQISLVEEIEKRQVPAYQDTILERYGMNFFKSAGETLPTAGVPDDYILSDGDSLKIAVYGLYDYEGELEINKDGKIIVPKVGAIAIRGLRYKVARSTVYSRLISTYPNSTIVITIGNTTPFSVSVVGEVRKPGLFTMGALSKVKDALIAAGGIGQNGTMREIQVRRDGKVVATFDLYDLLRGGKDHGDVYLYPNDVVFVSPTKNIVYFDGNVKMPAIYELKPNETLQDLLRISGGAYSDATETIKIFRSKNGARTLFEVDKNDKTILQDGDRIVIGKTSQVTDNRVFLYGNVYQNESLSIVKNDTVGTLFQRLIDLYGIEKVFMPHTDMGYFLIKRVDAKTLESKIFSGDLARAIAGDKNFDVVLQSEDKIFILNQSITQDIRYVSVDGEVLRSGKFKYFDGMKLIDALMTSGIKKESDLQKIKVTSITKENSFVVKHYTFEEAYSVLLKQYDEILVQNFQESSDYQKVSINGAVMNGGVFNYFDGMTLADLLNLAGGFRQYANQETIELVSYEVVSGVRKHSVTTLKLKDALAKNYQLKPFDEIMIRQISEWNEAKTITLQGEVNYPGVYTILPGEKLSSVIKRAGGLKDGAFVQGAVFTRVDIQKLQQEAFQKQLNDLESSILYLATQPDEAGKSSGSAELLQFLDSIRKRGEATQMIGRLAIKLDSNMEAFEKSPYDLVLKAGDTLVIPQIEQSVAIMGEVMNTTAVTYLSEKDLWDYVENAGGIKESGDEEGIFVVKANGEAKRIKKYFLLGYVNTKIEAGDTIVVPFKIDRFSGLKFAKDVTSIIYQIAVSAAALKTVGAL